MSTSSFKLLVSSLILALLMTCATSARILNEEVPVAPIVAPEDPEATPAVATTPVAPVVAPEDPETTPGAVATTTPVAPVVAPQGPGTAPGATGAAATTTPLGSGSAAATIPATTGAVAGEPHTLTFFMHDILGGSTPSATAVTGVVNNPAVNGQVPFAKPNGAVLPGNNGGVPTNNANGAVINNNNMPFLTGLSGTTPNIIQNNNGNNNNNNFNGGFGFNQLPTGPALQKLMFGTMTVFDDELTEGHELGSGVVGKAQGFYVTSAQDGLSQTMAFTCMFESGGYSDSLSFFGIHRTAVSESHLAIMGGTGKYVNAKGFALVKTFPAINQHSGDGVETVIEISVYLG